MSKERLIELHDKFNYQTWAWPSKGYANVVAENIRAHLREADPRLSDSRFVAVVGKGSHCIIEFPRIGEPWWPAGETTIELHLEQLIKALIKELDASAV